MYVWPLWNQREWWVNFSQNLIAKHADFLFFLKSLSKVVILAVKIKDTRER